MNKIQFAIGQIEKARYLTNNLLDGIDPERWYWQPHEGVTHVAWQVGHLATASYLLGLKIVRGEREEDESLCPNSFRQRYGRTSVPDPDPSGQPSASELRSTLDRIKDQIVVESSEWTESQLEELYPGEHPMFKTKLESFIWSAHHEIMHAGQIGLLRRLMGNEPIW